MNDKDKILFMLQRLGDLEDFIKISAVDNKIDIQTGNELLRITQEITEIGIK